MGDNTGTSTKLPDGDISLLEKLETARRWQTCESYKLGQEIGREQKLEPLAHFGSMWRRRGYGRTKKQMRRRGREEGRHNCAKMLRKEKQRNEGK